MNSVTCNKYVTMCGMRYSPTPVSHLKDGWSRAAAIAHWSAMTNGRVYMLRISHETQGLGGRCPRVLLMVTSQVGDVPE